MGENGLLLGVLGVLMFGLWTIAYIVIILKAHKDRSYGIPMLDGCLNVSWEAIYSFNLVAPLAASLNWGNRFWFMFDCINVLQVFLYGREMQSNEWVRKHFYAIAALTLIASAFGLYTFLIYFNDLYGVASSLLMDLLMYGLFIGAVFNRRDLRGLSYPGAWLMLAGNVAGFAFIYVWWPQQFVDGHLIGYPHVLEPRSYAHLNFLYVTVTAMNGLYIYLLRQRRLALAAEAR